jgi:hypothetical protein
MQTLDKSALRQLAGIVALREIARIGTGFAVPETAVGDDGLNGIGSKIGERTCEGHSKDPSGSDAQ